MLDGSAVLLRVALAILTYTDSNGKNNLLEATSTSDLLEMIKARAAGMDDADALLRLAQNKAWTFSLPFMRLQCIGATATHMTGSN